MKAPLLAFTFLLSAGLMSFVRGQETAPKPPRPGPDIAASSVSLAVPAVELSEREKSLIERIEKLEKRIDQLESAERSHAEQPVKDSSPKLPSSASTLPANDRISPNLPSVREPAAPKSPSEPKKEDPFTFADFTWLTGNPRTTESPISNEYFTAE